MNKNEFGIVLIGMIMFFVGFYMGNSNKESAIYKSCEQKQEYRISDTKALSCKATTLELNK
ncbi:hypothetical protein KY334_01500 [Candidatus Woesearchaeota archaeon]|nr:hypothetical protein [Candidatus Woesearchaeota archaeon]